MHGNKCIQDAFLLKCILDASSKTAVYIIWTMGKLVIIKVKGL